MLAKRMIGGVDVELELGVVRGKNPEHLANVHMLIKGLCRIRGIMVYKNKRGYFLRLPGYLKTPESKTKTAYTLLSQPVIDFIVDTVNSAPKESYVQAYSVNNWSIWGTPTKEQHSDNYNGGPDDGDACNIEDAGDRSGDS